MGQLHSHFIFHLFPSFFSLFGSMWSIAYIFVTSIFMCRSCHMYSLHLTLSVMEV